MNVYIAQSLDAGSLYYRTKEGDHLMVFVNPDDARGPQDGD
jgi:hypothetical protein